MPKPLKNSCATARIIFAEGSFPERRARCAGKGLRRFSRQGKRARGVSRLRECSLCQPGDSSTGGISLVLCASLARRSREPERMSWRAPSLSPFAEGRRRRNARRYSSHDRCDPKSARDRCGRLPILSDGRDVAVQRELIRSVFLSSVKTDRRAESSPIRKVSFARASMKPIVMPRPRRFA